MIITLLAILFPGCLVVIYARAGMTVYAEVAYVILLANLYIAHRRLRL